MGAKDYAGLTIHTGWYPQLMRSKTKPSKQFSRGATGKGVQISGPTNAFVQQVKELVKEEGGESRLRSIGQMVLKKGIPSSVVGFDYDTIGKTLGFTKTGGKRKSTWKDEITRGKDLAQGAEDWAKRSASFTLRGNHVWYLGRGGDTWGELAQEVHKRDFSFKKAEDWYRKKYGSAATGNMVGWAQKVLGLDGELQKVVLKDVEDKGRVAEEMVLKNNPYGMVKPEKPEGAAQSRDIDSAFGEIESTEASGLKHGLVKGKPKYGDTSAEAEAEWSNYMENTVIKAWNKYATKALEYEKKGMDDTNKWIAKTASKKANKALKEKGMNLAASQKMRHEAAIGMIKRKAGQSRHRWKEGIPVTDRDRQTGQRTYASTTVDYNNKNMTFTHKKTLFLTAVNHMAGIVENEQGANQFNTKGHYISQQNHMVHMQANNEGAVRNINNKTFQSISKSASGINHATNVSFSPKAAKEWMYTLGDLIGKELTEEIKKKTKKVKAAVDKKKKLHSGNGGMFWALPYIGIEEGLTIAK